MVPLFHIISQTPYLCAKFRRCMGFKSMKSLLVAVFSLFLLLFPYSAFPQEKPAEHKTAEEKFDPTTAILNHVQDAYEFHFFSVGDFHASIYLPVILYSPQKGFSIFSAKRFGHDHDQTYDGYRMQGENAIVPLEVGAAGLRFFNNQECSSDFNCAGAVHDSNDKNWE